MHIFLYGNSFSKMGKLGEVYGGVIIKRLEKLKKAQYSAEGTAEKGD